MNQKTTITICLGSSCYRRGNQTTLEVIKEYLKKNNLNDNVEFKGHLCTGNCANGPNIQINEELHQNIDNISIIEILDKYFNKL